MAALPNGARLGDWLVPVPKTMTTADAMAVGTAGYTAMLCLMALEHEGVKPGDGESWSLALPVASARSPSRCSRSSASVVASTGRPEEAIS